MNISSRQFIALFTGLVFFYLSLTPVFSQTKKVFKFQEGMPAQDDIDMTALPLISDRFIDEGDFYLVRGKKIFLKKDSRRIAVKFKHPIFSRLQNLSGRKELRSDFLKQVLNLTSSNVEPVIEKQVKKSDITIIKTSGPSATSPQPLYSQIQAIAASDSVEYANPVFLPETILTSSA